MESCSAHRKHSAPHARSFTSPEKRLRSGLRHQEWAGTARATTLHSEKVWVQLGVAVLLRPQVERSGSEFVDYRLGAAILREVDRLNVGLADIAAFHANVVEVAGRVDREFLVVLLAAS